MMSMSAAQDKDHKRDAPAAHAQQERADSTHAVSGEHETDHEEGEIEYLLTGHGIFNLLVFLLLGIPMGLSGLHRLLTTTGVWKTAPFGFTWAMHVSKGRIFVVAAILGLCGGLLIFALDGFDPGHALPHLAAGVALSVLFVIGGLTGSRMAKGHAPLSLKYTHAACNMLGIALFLFQIASGLYMLLAH